MNIKMSFCSESSIIIEAGQRLASVTTRGRRLGRGQSRLASDSDTESPAVAPTIGQFFSILTSDWPV